MPLRDLYGNPVSSSSRAAVDAYDRGVRGLLGYGGDVIDCFRQSLAADPEFVLARAALGVSLYLAEKIPEARAEMARAAAAASTTAVSPREARHVGALAVWVSGRGNEAVAPIKAILAEHPRDMLLMQRLYYIYFWQGRSAEMLELTQSVLPALGEDGYMLGYHAFALEENGRFGEALPLAERAIALNPQDAWAVHAVAHVFYERGENARGIAALPASIHPCSHLGYFKNHLLWHLALMHLAEGRYERVRRLFEGVFGGLDIDIASDLQDAVALAWRLDLYGQPDAARWIRLAAAAHGWLEMPLLLFHDLHVGMALSASGDWSAAEMQLERLRERGKKSRHRTLPEVVVPLMEGLHAFSRGDYAASLAHIEPVADRIVEVGGSNAQREVFHDTLLEAALRAGLPDRARTLLERRIAKRPNPGRHWLEARI